jgi:hypothetical protein
MEAQCTNVARRAAARRTVLLAAVLLVAMGARQRTDNFIIETPDPAFSQQVAQAAEKFRHDLAIEWVGKPMPNWYQPCVMTVQVGPHLGAGGATTFVFDHGEVFGWRMSIQGSAERVLDSVLPHEITHMVFASHFRQPLPRWADEGGATSVEHASEKNKYRQMLGQFLHTGHGIAFDKMFAMTEYPSDMMPLYAEGYSLAEYLIQSGGRRKYVEFLGDGLKDDDWTGAVQRHYGPKDLGTLQSTWLAWVNQGSPALAPREVKPAVASGEMLAANERRPLPEPNLIYHIRDEQASATTAATTAPAATVATPARLVPVNIPSTVNASRAAADGQAVTAIASSVPVRATVAATSWSDPRQPVASSAVQVTANDSRGKSTAPPVAGWRVPGQAATVAAAPEMPPSVDPLRTQQQVTHPQSPEQPRQTVLE